MAVAQTTQAPTKTQTSEKTTASRWWINALAAAFPSLVGIQIISNLYFGNANELNSGPGIMTQGIAACLMAWLVLWAIVQYGRTAGKVIWSIATAYSIFYLIRDVCFPLPLGVLDGTAPLDDISTKYFALEIGTLVAAAAVLISLPSRVSRSLSASFAGIFLLSIVITFIEHKELLAASTTAIPTSAIETQHSKIASLVDPKLSAERAPNIYHILFDQYQTVLYDAVREIVGDRGPFEDFIFFRNNISNYNRTFIALPGLFTSHLYQSGEDWNTWRSSHLNAGLFQLLQERGYSVSAFGHSQGDWRSPHIDYVRASLDIGEDAQAGDNIRQVAVSADFGQLLKLRSLPSFVGGDIVQQTRSQVDKSQPIPPAGDYAYYASMMFRELVDNLKHQSAHGNYIFVHMCLPHGPYVLDAKGNYVGRDRNKANELTHTLFIETLMREFNAELKRLDRYDESLIIVHADTGDYINTDLKKSDWKTPRLASAKGNIVREDWKDGAKWSLPVVKARAQAILLMKPPKHRGYVKDESPTSLLDIVPTIAEVAGIEARSEFEGISLLSERPKPDRVRRNYVLGKKIGGVRVKHMQEYVVKEDQFERGALIPTGE